MDLQTHIHEKRIDFNVMDVQPLAEKVRARNTIKDEDTLAQSGQTTEVITVAAGELERQEWELAKGKLEYDKQ
eukprot:6429062-Lingulodinium_polyedra.AAC.1